MRVLHLLKSNKFSGAENVAIEIIKLFPEEEMVYASPEGSIRAVVEKQGITFYPLKGTNVPAVRSAIKELHPDLVHAHDFTMAANAAFASEGTPIVAHLHNNPPWLYKVHPKTLIFALALPKIKQIISVSNSVEDEYLFSALMKKKNNVIGNVVDTKKVKTMAQHQVEEENAEAAFIGRLTAQKNPLLFCEIIKRLKNTDPTIHSIMIGDGELKNDIQAYILANELDQNIHMIGFKENPYPYLKNSKIVIMPSSWEGFGLTAVESLVLGKPVLCSGVGGLNNIVDDSCGAVCHTVQEYTKEIHRLLKDETYYSRKSAGALITASRFSDMEAYKEKILEIYRRLLPIGEEQ